jgi:hypothetical protein
VLGGGTHLVSVIMRKKIVLLVCLLSLLVQQQQIARAQALPILEETFSGTINEAIASAVESNLTRRGITVAANDATMASTEQYIGQAVNDASYASTALTTVAAVAGAPVWLTVALGVGALAVAGGIAWGVYQLTQNNASSGSTPDGQPMPASISLTPTGTTQPAPIATPSGAWTSYTSPSCNSAITTTCSGNAALPSSDHYYTQGYPNSGTVIGCISGADCAQQTAAAWVNFEAMSVTNVNATWSPITPGSIDYDVSITWTPLASNPTDTGVVETVDPMTNPNYVPVPQPVTGPLSSIEPELTPSMLAQPVPQQLLADMANQLWQDAAAQPGYNGEPYSPTDPLTAQDIATAPVAPTWNDLVNTAPAPVGSTVVPIAPTVSTSPVTVPITEPASSTTPTTENPCTEDPTASACQPLGTAPTPPPIPASSAAVTLSPWSIGPSSGQCPAPITVNVLGSPLVFDYTPLCSLASQLQPLVLALCALAAALIIVMGIKG